MKKKIILLILCIFAVSGFLVFYMTRGNEKNNVPFSSFCYGGENQMAGGGGGISTIQVNASNKLKINVNLHITDGEYTIGLYYIPEDNIMYKFHYASEEEIIHMYDTGEFNTQMFTTDGLECVYEKKTGTTGAFVIDTTGWKDGLYAISTITSKDAVLNGTISIGYVYYNWMKVIEKVTKHEKYTPR